MQTKFVPVNQPAANLTEVRAEKSKASAPVELDLSVLDNVAGGAPNATWVISAPDASLSTAAPNHSW